MDELRDALVLLGLLFAHRRGRDGLAAGTGAADYALGAVASLDTGSGSTCGSGHDAGC